MVRSEKFLNDVSTALNGAITLFATSITVSDGSLFPAEGDYRLSLDNEIILVTHRATNVLTVVRGVDGTVAASHIDTTPLFAIFTQQAADQYVKDFIDPNAFDRTGVHRLLDINGNTLTKSNFTELNLETGTVIDDTWGGITQAMTPGAGPDIRVIFKSAPSTPYVLEAHILSGIFANDVENANLIGFRESSSGKLSFISYHYADRSFVQYLDGPTTPDAGGKPQLNIEVPARADYWLRIEDDGTNLTYLLSGDGFNYFQLKTELRTFHFDSAPDGILWGGDNQGNDGELIHLLSWIES